MSGPITLLAQSSADPPPGLPSDILMISEARHNPKRISFSYTLGELELSPTLDTMSITMPVSRTQLWHTYVALERYSCLRCQWRSFSFSYRLNGEREDTATSTSPSNPLDEVPRARGKAIEKFTPKPLSRPIGISKPPKAGENSGRDTRSWRQRRDDFVNYDKHLDKRKELTKRISVPYFREWSNMRHHKGKSFLSPPRLFKSDVALYFPNLQGQTLVKGEHLRDTTPVLENKISIVSVFSSAWAEGQAASFVAEKNNPELHKVVKESGGKAQMVQLNIEEDALKAAIIRLFMPNLRRTITQGNWGRYFLIRRGVTEEMREAIGLINSKVGYTYLLDGKCRIRWAGSGVSEANEKEGLVKGTIKLIQEAREKRLDTQTRTAVPLSKSDEPLNDKVAVA